MRVRCGLRMSGILLAFSLAPLIAASACQQEPREDIEVRRGATTANPLLYPYCSASGCSGGVTFNVADVTQAWTDWKTRHITAMPAGTCAVPTAPQFRVCKLDDSSTVSEGQGYGMIFAALFDEQAVFDGLWLWTKGRFDAQGLMTWKICADGANNTNCGSGAATDGDEDMALGLVFACMKKIKGAWGAGAQGINYCADATTLVNAIYNREIEQAGPAPTMVSGASNGINSTDANQLIPGDQWGSEPAGGLVNLSYFAPGWYTVFGKFMDSANASPPGSGNATKWGSVVSKNYSIANTAQTIGCSKLIPDWVSYAGAAQSPGFDGNFADWFFDGARFAVRIAIDKAWYNTASAAGTINPIGSFFRSAGSANWRFAYHTNGTSFDVGGSPFFTADAAAAVWSAGAAATAVNCGAATGQTAATPQAAYNAALATVEPSSSNFTYFNNAWRLNAMLLMTGNFPNIYELAVAAGTIPAPPTGLTATAGNAQVALGWTASAGATSYNVLRSTTSGSGYVSVATGVTTTSFTNTGLTNGTTYFFVVQAVNAAGTSANSAQASATPTAGGSGPCASFCANPTIYSTANFQSGNLTTAARCFQTTANLAGGNCSNMTGRTLSVNGTSANCNGWSLPAKVNNGYCIQVTAGGVDWASFATW